MRLRVPCCFSFALPFLAVAAAATTPTPDELHATRLVQAHLGFLADDLVEGRGTGTRGYRIAAAYVASQFQRLGLQPAGSDGSWLQPVPMQLAQRVPAATSLRIERAGSEPVTLAMPADFSAETADGSTSAEISGPAVFVGYGVHAPDHGYSDFEGIDLRGKIAVVFAHAPATLPGTVLAHHSNRDIKLAELARRGAVGVITLGSNSPSAAAADAKAGKTSSAPSLGTWSGSLALATASVRTLLEAPGGKLAELHPGLRITATLSPARATTLFAHAPRPFAELLAAGARCAPASCELGVNLTLRASVTLTPLACHNVLGLLPGSDPALTHDALVVTCHLDHLGMRAPENGDAIFNGALDNASGVSVVLAAAERLVRETTRPRRPILFAAVTGEEGGHHGSRHLARHPPSGLRYAANVNLDMALFLGPLRSAVGFGREHSTLGTLLEAVAARSGWSLHPDPNPTQRLFVRSDQFSFVRAGVPALYLTTAEVATDPSIDLAARNRDFMRQRYHKRNDDLSQPIDYPSAGAFAVFASELIRSVADLADAPAWLPGDFFGTTFGRR